MAKMETNLSLASLNELIKRLETKKENLPQTAVNIADRLADEMLSEVQGVKAYGDTYKVSAQIEGSSATAGIKNETAKAYFHEYGTGVKGTGASVTSETWQKAVAEMNWQPSGNGWWYPTTEADTNPTKRLFKAKDGYQEGWYAWTSGLEPVGAFSKALDNAEERFIEVGKEELEREAEKNG